MFKSCMNYSFTPGVMCAALLTLQGPTVKRNFRNGLAPRFADAAQRRPSFQSPTTMHKQKQKACSKLQESRQSKEGKRGVVSLNFKAVFARVLRGTRPRPATPWWSQAPVEHCLQRFCSQSWSLWDLPWPVLYLAVAASPQQQNKARPVQDQSWIAGFFDYYAVTTMHIILRYITIMYIYIYTFTMIVILTLFIDMRL
jgi:hypothetical protein